MSVVGDVFGAGGVATLVGKAIDKIWPDTTEQDKAKLDLLKQQIAGDLQLQLGQLEIDKVEAGSEHIFVSGWRPFIGWVCGAALAYNFIGYQIILYFSTVAGIEIGKLPFIDSSQLMTLVLSLLGLGGMRSYEKVKGV